MKSPRQSLRWPNVAIITAALSLLVMPVRASEVDALVKSLRERRLAVRSLHTVTTTQARGKGAARKMVFEYWEVKGEKSRKMRRIGKMETKGDTTDVGNPGESLTVSDGEHEWSQLPGASGKVIVKSKAGSSDALGQVSDALKQGKARTKPGAPILGMDTVVVEIVGTSSGASYKATYWISEKHGVLLRSSVRHADGSGMEMEATKCEVNGEVSSELFTFHVPEGAQVIDTTSIGHKKAESARP